MFGFTTSTVPLNISCIFCFTTTEYLPGEILSKEGIENFHSSENDKQAMFQLCPTPYTTQLIFGNVVSRTVGGTMTKNENEKRQSKQLLLDPVWSSVVAVTTNVTTGWSELCLTQLCGSESRALFWRVILFRRRISLFVTRTMEIAIEAFLKCFCYLKRRNYRKRTNII